MMPDMLAVWLLLSCAPRAALPPSPAVVEVAAAAPTLAALPFPGDPAVASAARDVLALLLTIHPDRAADAGLLRDGLHVPSFAPAAIAAHLDALDAAAARLAAIPQDDLPIADRIDLKILIAAVAEAQHAYRVEQRWRHRPAEWLEPLSTLLIAHTAAPEPVEEALDILAGHIPAMVAELRVEVTAPTAQDVATALGLIDGIALVLEAEPTPVRAAAAAELRDYAGLLAGLEGLPEQRMIGAEAYRWRLEHALMLQWDAEELLRRAEADLAAVDAEIAALEAIQEPQEPPTDEERALAASLDQAGVLALYDRMVAEDLAALRELDLVTIPDDLPPMRARPTPAALIPLTGDGGSMNPIPPFGPTDGAWWNVERFQDAPLDARLGLVVTMRRHHQTWYGPYAAHEGVPGHHLQLTITRGIDRPVRTLLPSSPAIEGWALYAEEIFEQHGGFGGTPIGRLVMLRSYRARIKRVIFDVKVETGAWSLQDAADWKHGAAPGEGRIDPELLRTVQWPTQLIGYYAGKAEILALKAEVRAAWGADFTERAFHDALLAEGSIPVSLAREALLDPSRPRP
jgi:uncharacterized protein (DUF885 family)